MILKKNLILSVLLTVATVLIGISSIAGAEMRRGVRQ